MENSAPIQSLEIGHNHKIVDDDGRVKRTGTMWTASAHIITAVIGSGVLSLGWAMAQLGWIAGPVALMVFSVVTWFTSLLLADAYRSPDPVTGNRNYTYIESVKANLGGFKVQLCGFAQYVNLVGVSIAFTITASISMAAVQRSNCFHIKGHKTPCLASNYSYIAIFAGFQIVLSQIPNFHKLSGLSVVAAIMSFAYSFIGIGLAIARIAGGDHHVRMSLSGVAIGRDVTSAEKVWRVIQSLGDIGAAYTFSMVLVEIQDTLKTSPPENQVMKKATSIGISTTTIFYMLCGCLGYAAFGNDAPGNFLTGFGFYDPFWLVDVGNICIAIHLLGAYQVFCQPIYRFVELRAIKRWPGNGFVAQEYVLHIPFCAPYSINAFRLLWRTTYIVATTIVAMIFPFFNNILGLIGAFSFWPLTVYLPIEMHIKQAKVPRLSTRWVWLQALSAGCFAISLISAIGSIQGLTTEVQDYKPFKNQSGEVRLY